MPQSLANILIHLVFSTKNRAALLRPRELRLEMFAYLATLAARNCDSPALIVGGSDDHIHLLLSMSRKVAMMKIVEELKTESSKWVKSKSNDLHSFAWQHIDERYVWY